MNTCQAAGCSKTFKPQGVGTRIEKKYCSKKCRDRENHQRRKHTPQRKAYLKEYLKEYHQTPQYKAYLKEYHQTPQYKAYQKEYQKTPQWKARRKAYRRNNPRVQGLRKHAPFLARRDGHLCRWCRRPLDYRFDPFHIDHIVPRKPAHGVGGSDDRANLCLSCPSCNQRKSNRMPDPTNAEQARFDFPLQLEFPPCASL